MLTFKKPLILTASSYKLLKNGDNKMKSKFLGTIMFIFLMVVAVLGMLAYVLQNQYGAGTTFADFFEMMRNGQL